MRALQITRKILVIIAVALFGLGLLVAGMMDGPDRLIGLDAELLLHFPVLGPGLVFGLLIAAGILMFNENKIMRALAIGVATAVFTYGLIFFLAVTNNAGTSILVGLVAAIVYAISWVFQIIIAAVRHVRREDGEDPADDKRVRKIMEWKNLLDQEIITEEEFMAKRNAILGIENKPAKPVK